MYTLPAREYRELDYSITSLSTATPYAETTRILFGGDARRPPPKALLLAHEEQLWWPYNLQTRCQRLTEPGFAVSGRRSQQRRGRIAVSNT